MAEGASYYAWPTNLTEDMVANGDLTRSQWAVVIGRGIRSLLGWGHSHGTACWQINAAAVIIAPTETRSFPVRLGPYARDLEVRIVADGQRGLPCKLQISAAGVDADELHWTGGGTTNHETVGWSASVILPAVGDGAADTYTVAAEPNAVVTYTNNSVGADIALFFSSVRELHNHLLTQ